MKHCEDFLDVLSEMLPGMRFVLKTTPFILSRGAAKCIDVILLTTRPTCVRLESLFVLKPANKPNQLLNYGCCLFTVRLMIDDCCSYCWRYFSEELSNRRPSTCWSVRLPVLVRLHHRWSTSGFSFDLFSLLPVVMKNAQCTK